jgi:S-DNA-T family DNA segregation ATPase FtsK/SpoIIIE
MTADNASVPGPEPVDWNRYESELGAGRAGTPTKPAATHAPVDPDDATAVLVDSPQAQRADSLTLSGLRAAQRRPILPAWLRSAHEFRAMVGWAAGFAGYTSLYYLSRTPAAAGRLAARSPHGLARTLGGWRRWLFDAEGEPLRRVSADRADAETYLKLARQRDRRVRWRAIVTTLLLASLAAAVIAVVAVAGWARLAAVALAVGVLGKLGQPADRPLIQRPVAVAKAPRLTSDQVVTALGSLGIAAINQALAKRPDASDWFVSPIHRDGPLGWRADLDLPLGVVPGDVINQRARLASALRRKLGCVWPEGDPTAHEGRLVLWVGDRDLAERRGKGLSWPLVRAGSHDIFTPAPFGEDPRGHRVAVPLVQHNVLIGAMPGQGKTGAVVVLCSAAALDPLVELWPHELKGSGDLDAYAAVAHRFVSGIDDESIAYAADSLGLLRAEVVRRTKALKQLPRELCPDKRVTRQIAERRQLGLQPLVCVIDECQHLFGHPAYGAQAGSDAEFIIKIGRAYGVVLVLATQRPDKDSLPTGVSGNVSIRFCLKVAGQVENDMILGTSAYKRGLNAALFRPEIDAGIGYLLGATSTPTVACAAYLDVAARERVATRARVLRERAGTLSGHALGQAPEQPRQHETLLEDTLGVLPAGEDRIANEDLRERLAATHPGAYGDWGTERLTAALRDAGIDPREAQVNRTDADGERRNRRGIYRQSVVDALTQRGRKGAAD